MQECIEIAIFTVDPQDIAQVISLSHSIFAEMNQSETVILSYQILQKQDNPQELSWHLVWKNAQIAQETTAKWPTFPSTAAFQALVKENIYYGHFRES